VARGSKRCTRCGGEYDFAFFHPRACAKEGPILPTAGQLYRDHCIGCETTSQSEELITQRSLRMVAHLAHQRAGRRTELRRGATPYLSGAAHQRHPAPD
jgi:hypothetical protein